ncbi:MAG: 2-succinyl-5-enolpyruvyl-6-hydroxy-3-cyclohexene-1-carboxylic-acid synthase [Puniceicoccaceae bacterium]
MPSETESTAGRANRSYGELVIGALRALGAGHFVLSPGSRSTPLALALAKLPAESVTVCIDERSAAFYALGRIKATREPAVLICTSGTAGAHYYPALIEARESGMPLVVLTADRPPELRHCHAGQTIDQLKLFGNYPVFQAELPLPEADPLLFRQVRELCRRAMESAVGAPRGPVHLNCPFREPFQPSPEEEPFELDPGLLSDLSPVRRTHASPGQRPELPERTLILAGPRPWLDEASEWESLLDLSWSRGFPILVDAANPLRYHSGECPHLIIHYDRIVRDDTVWEELKPEAVILWGEPPTSKVLRQRLRDMDIRGYIVGEGKRGINPLHGKIEWAGKNVAAFVERTRGDKGHYGEPWATRDREMEEHLLQVMAAPHDLFEGDIHRKLGEILPEAAPIIYSSSLAVRDAEWFMPRRRAALHPFSQRGANGIDGMLSLSRGIAAGMGQPTWLVTGDLAFLHDTNGLLESGKDDPGLFVILINNGGGGIFEFLPIAKEEAVFESYFATPQSVDFGQLIAAYGGQHSICRDINELDSAIRGWNGKGLRVLEVPVERKVSRDLHRAFLKLSINQEK